MFRKALAVPLSQLSINTLVQDILLHPEYFEDMYRLTADENQTVSWRAIWVCQKLSEIHPDWFIPLYDEITQRLLACKHDGSKRLLLSVLYNTPIPDPLPVPLLNYCLDHMLSPQESIGVQALAIRMAYLLCKQEPELLQELRLILENTELEYYSTGVNATVRNTLKKIRKR